MNQLAGSLRLIRLAFRRDRIRMPAWILAMSAFVGVTTAMFAADFDTRADVVRETRIVATNVGMRMLGLTSGPSVGGYMLHREFVTLAVLAAVMSTLTVVRHTRQDEELGRAEIFGSTVVGHSAAMLAAVVTAAAANVLLAAGLGVAMVLAGMPVAGSFLAGASVATVGLVFVGVAAVTCQLSSTSRGASGMSAAVLGIAFLLSGIGNMSGSVDQAGLRVTSAWPAWVSPLGWGQQTRPFAPERSWWPLLLAALAGCALILLAAALLRRRDVGRGIWPERRGPAEAAPTLLSSFGLAWRLQRGVLLGWTIGMAAFGLIFGTLTEQVLDAGGGTADWYTSVAGTDQLADAFRTSMTQMGGMFVGIYVVQVLLRAHTDEVGGTLEPVLATHVSRLRWLLGHLANATIGAVVLMLVFGVGMALTAGRVLHDTATELRELPVAALAQVPGSLVLGALVVLAVALVPRHATAIGWGLLLAFFVVGPMFGPGLGLPQWLQDLSPFSHLPKAPAVDVTVTPIVALLALCLALVAVSVALLRRRDLALPA